MRPRLRGAPRVDSCGAVNTPRAHAPAARRAMLLNAAPSLMESDRLPQSRVPSPVLLAIGDPIFPDSATPSCLSPNNHGRLLNCGLAPLQATRRCRFETARAPLRGQLGVRAILPCHEPKQRSGEGTRAYISVDRCLTVTGMQEPTPNPKLVKAVWLLAVMAIGAVLYFAQDVFIPVAVALFLALLLTPAVDRLQGWGVRRGTRGRHRHVRGVRHRGGGHQRRLGSGHANGWRAHRKPCGRSTLACGRCARCSSASTQWPNGPAD